MSCLPELPISSGHDALVVVVATLPADGRNSLEDTLRDEGKTSQRRLVLVYCLDNVFQHKLERLGREGMCDAFPIQRFANAATTVHPPGLWKSHFPLPALTNLVTMSRPRE